MKYSENKKSKWNIKSLKHVSKHSNYFKKLLSLLGIEILNVCSGLWDTAGLNQKEGKFKTTEPKFTQSHVHNNALLLSI